MTGAREKVAIVLMNLGGPDRPAAVRPFLFNLFKDPAIIDLPQPLRWLLALSIAARRAPIARAIYGKIGGASPLLANTQAQARALEAALGGAGALYRCFIAMRYWHPFSAESARAVAAWEPQRVVLLPLYPQFSTTTTASSIAAWHVAARRVGLVVPTTALCCYPDADGFVAAVAAEIAAALEQLPAGTKPRVLFSAHGLPQKIIRAGDPYQWQVERSVAAICSALGRADLDRVICYQSRVGRLAWLGPATSAEIARAGRQGRAVIMVPIAFVSEHSETLVELDIDYRHLARASGVPLYRRVPTVGIAPPFIAGLAALVRAAAALPEGIVCPAGRRLCPSGFARCPATAGATAA